MESLAYNNSSWDLIDILLCLSKKRLATPSEVARTLIERLPSGVSKGVTVNLDLA